MTKAKSSQARAAKRNARAKAKKISANKARTTPTQLDKKSYRRAFGDSHLDFDQVLSNAVRDINQRKQVAGEITSPIDVLKGLQKTAGEVFKLYSYITLVQALIEQKLIDHRLVIDLKAISLDLINIDGRVQNVAKLIEKDEEEVVFTEALDISTSLQNHAEELYAEVTRTEPHALVIEESLSRLAKEVEGINEPDAQRLEVLQSLAYQYLSKVKEEADSQVNTDPQPETAAAVAE